MKRMTTTELAHSIKATLEEVRAGEYVEITRRGEVVARIVPPDEDSRTPLERLMEASRELGEDGRESLTRTVREAREFMGEDHRAWT